MKIRIAALVAVAVAGCASDPPPTAVTVAATSSAAPLVIGTGDVAHPAAKVATEGTDLLDDAPAVPQDPVGAKAPGFKAKPVNGKPVSPFKDRVTVIHFWATWCGPCKLAMPELQKLYTKEHGRGLDVIAVSVDDVIDDVGDFVKDVHATFPVGWDDGQATAKKYTVTSMPSTYVIDREGTIRFVHQGYHQGEEAEVAKEVEGLL